MPQFEKEETAAQRFTSTCWTAVARAREQQTPEARQALADLCQAYWYPLYAYLRRRGQSPHEAEDLTQGFIADLLARDFLRDVDPAKGKFRSFLLAALQHYLSNQRDHANRLKRGGKVPHVSLDFHVAESCYLR